ncbi:hypothetical protein [Nonomuraea aurantiaca]|uniref:hypothetical protein n=1 Tax=Nonomuraea aurantiaca TaxID=2878562 RepID=UPI001CD95865|nr:hypothetical protein [Nonomuraea aurantiaca]MCA2220144.1 hypothetical protein [Nonomuraea aurantiaca]
MFLLAAQVRFDRRWPRVVLLVLLWPCTGMAAVWAVGMLGGAPLTDRSGAVFRGYCAVWAVLLFQATRHLQHCPRQVAAP